MFSIVRLDGLEQGHYPLRSNQPCAKMQTRTKARQPVLRFLSSSALCRCLTQVSRDVLTHCYIPALLRSIISLITITEKQKLVTQLCLTLCDPVDCSPPRLPCPWDFPGKGTGVGCHFLRQGIFLTQGLNLGLLNCRQILYHLSHQESPIEYVRKYL